MERKNPFSPKRNPLKPFSSSSEKTGENHQNPLKPKQNYRSNAAFSPPSKEGVRRRVTPSEGSSGRLIFGIRAVLEAIHAGKDIDKILVRRELSSELAKELFTALKNNNIPVQRVPIEKLNRLTQKNHQGVIAFMSEVEYQHIADIIPALYEEGKMPFVVMLDGVTDVRNFGAIARTCECAGVDALVVATRGGAAANADAVKTSAGALHAIPVCRENNLAETVQFLKNSGLKAIAATEKSSRLYTQISYQEPLVIVMGSEDAGISDEVLKCCDEQISIPVRGSIASLNVSVATGILAYEALRQRQLS